MGQRQGITRPRQAHAERFAVRPWRTPSPVAESAARYPPLDHVSRATPCARCSPYSCCLPCPHCRQSSRDQRGINGAAFFFLRLPHSKPEVDLPLIAAFPPGDPPDVGLKPDLLVNPNAVDLSAGLDSRMQAVRAALCDGTRD